MDKKYWDKFYKKERNLAPSNFVKFCQKYIKKGETLIELGCGNGRDLRFLRKKGIRAFGIDLSFEGDYIIKKNVKKHIGECQSPKYIYTRFFWHSIDRSLQLKILDWAQGYLFIETRIKGDKPKDLFGKHKRSTVECSQLIEDLLKRGFAIERFKKGRGLSKYKNEDPLVVWIVAKK